MILLPTCANPVRAGRFFVGVNIVYSENEIYSELAALRLSHSCDCQAVLFLPKIEEYLLSDFSMKHSLIRLLARPLYYMGFDADCFFEWLNENFGGKTELIRFFHEQRDMVAKVFEELDLCVKYYDTGYDNREAFVEDFKKLGISHDEILRIYGEEAGR